jgi:hypothetical protein
MHINDMNMNFIDVTAIRKRERRKGENKKRKGR